MASLDYKHSKILYVSAISVCISADRDASKNYFHISCGRKQKRNKNCFKSRRGSTAASSVHFELVETKREASADKSSTINRCESYIRLLICECKSNAEPNSILVEMFTAIFHNPLILLRLHIYNI